MIQYIVNAFVDQTRMKLTLESANYLHVDRACKFDVTFETGCPIRENGKRNTYLLYYAVKSAQFQSMAFHFRTIYCASL